LLQYQHEIAHKDRQIEELRTTVMNKDNELVSFRNNLSATGGLSRRRGVSTGAFIALLLLTIAFGALAAYSLLKDEPTQPFSSRTLTQTDTSTGSSYEEPISGNATLTDIVQAPVDATPEPVADTATTTPETTTPPQTQEPQQTTGETNNQQQTDTASANPPVTNSVARYTVASDKAYFHNEPDESTRRAAYMIPSNEVVLQPLQERNGFIYVVFTNSSGQTSKGWLRKEDLKLIEE